MRELTRPRVSRPTRRARRPAHPASVGLGAHHGRAPVSDRLARSFAPRVSARVSAGRLEVGVVLPTYRALASAENIARAAALSESLGFDSVWVTDHVVVPTASVEAFGPTFFEAMTVMSYVAGITTKIHIGAAILIVPYRHPLLLAKMVATADQLSGGRIILGAGLGWLEAESTLMGVPHRRRARAAAQALAAMRARWASEAPDFRGEGYGVVGVPFGPRPHPRSRRPIP